MRKKIWLCAAILWAGLMQSCTGEQFAPEQNGLQITMTAPDFEDAVSSRVDIEIGESGAQFTWADNDTVGIFPNQGGQVYFPMLGGAGTKTASFTGGGWALKSSATYAAYYPYYILNQDLSKIAVSYDGQVQAGYASTAHLGRYDFMAAKAVTPEKGTVNFNFKHMGCLVELNLTYPKATEPVSVVLSSAESVFMSKGVLDLTQDQPALHADRMSTSLTVGLKDIATKGDNGTLKVYLLVNPMNLEGKTLSVKSGGYEGFVDGKNMEAGKSYKYTAVLQPSGLTEGFWVDLGLSVKWSSHNLGASQPEEYGDFYAWGEIETKDSFTPDNGLTMNKHFDESISGDPQYDAATAIWKAPARIPTEAEIQELVDNCYCQWTTYKGINGFLFVSKINTNSIFLPAAGRCFKITVFRKGEEGHYWTATARGRDDVARHLDLRQDRSSMISGSRFQGYSIRPVSD